MLVVWLCAALLISMAPEPSASRAIVLANLMSDTDEFGNVDGRGSITAKAGQLGLSEADVQQIRASVGYVICPAGEGRNPAAMSATVVGTNMQIATAAHAFIEFSGKVRAPLSACFFRNQEEPFVKVMLDVETGYFNGASAGGARHPSFPDEWAVVALQAPVANARPFRIGSGIANGARIIAVAAHQKTPANFDPKQPVVASCRKRDQAPGGRVGFRLYTDCDMTPLASGGPILRRAEDGELVFHGIIVGGGDAHLDGQPYDLSTGSYTRVVPPLNSFKDAIRNVAKSVRLVHGDALEVSPE